MKQTNTQQLFENVANSARTKVIAQSKKSMNYTASQSTLKQRPGGSMIENHKFKNANNFCKGKKQEYVITSKKDAGGITQTGTGTISNLNTIATSRNAQMIHITSQKALTQFSHTINGAIIDQKSQLTKNYSNSILGNFAGGQSNATINKRYIEEQSSHQSSKVWTSSKNTILLSNSDFINQGLEGANNQQQQQDDQKKKVELSITPVVAVTVADQKQSSKFLNTSNNNKKNEKESDDDSLGYNQIYSFSKTPKFGTNKINFCQVVQNTEPVQSNSNILLSDRFLKINDNLYSSRSSHELNEQIFEEYNSNNNEEERIKKIFEIDKQQIQYLRESKQVQHQLQQQQKQDQGVQQKYNSLEKTNESNRIFNTTNFNELLDYDGTEFLKESLQYSSSSHCGSLNYKNANNVNEQNVQKPNEIVITNISPVKKIYQEQQNLNNCNSRSKTPTVISSTCLKESFDIDNLQDGGKQQHSKIRPAFELKNPFAKKAILNQKIIELSQKGQIKNQNLVNVQRCQTEVSPYKVPLYSQSVIEILESEKTNNIHKECNKKLVDEQEKHQATKRALNKAIQLANALIDELQLTDQKILSAGMNSSCCFYNSTTSFTQSRFHTPEPNFVQQNKSKQDQTSSFNVVIGDNIDQSQFNNNNNLNNTNSIRQRQRSPNKELQDLTNLIRKTKQSPLIKKHNGFLGNSGYQGRNNNHNMSKYNTVNAGDSKQTITYQEQTDSQQTQEFNNNIHELVKRMARIQCLKMQKVKAEKDTLKSIENSYNSEGNHNVTTTQQPHPSISKTSLLNIKKLTRSLIREICDGQQ